MKKYGSAKFTPVNKFSNRNRYRVGNRLAKALPFELQRGIQSRAGRDLHRALQSIVNVFIRRGNYKLKRYVKPAAAKRFYQK